MKVLIILPPFTQINSPYSSLPYLQGFLRSNGIGTGVLDLGIKTTSAMYSQSGLEILKNHIIKKNSFSDGNSEFFIENFDLYYKNIDLILGFLKGNEDSLPSDIPLWKMSGSALSRNVSGLNAEEYDKYIATMYLEDVYLFYRSVCPDYGFSRYGEKLSLSPAHSASLIKKTDKDDDLISFFIDRELDRADISTYDIIALSVPFPGTLAGALKCCRYIKTKHPEKITVLGGGYVNTELRNMSDPEIFKYADYVCLDDGEIPLLQIIDMAKGKITGDDLVRTYFVVQNKVRFVNGNEKQHEIKRGIPDYSGIRMDDYIPVLESVNPMLRLWSENKTLKIRMAKGCYWHKCSFCDTSLPYIKDFIPENINDLITDIETLIMQTGIRRFHFTDEAISPSHAVRLALELIKKGIKIEWWGNIRFDKAFTEDVCSLLKHSGFIAAVGGLESGSADTLKRMNKGIDIEEAVTVMKNFRRSKILVHAYMIYGFPGETEQDIIDSAEVLRQLFEAGLVNSAFWHRFSLTVHSPVFFEREKYGVEPDNYIPGPFANNDISYIEKTNNDPDKFSEGLKKSVYNFMLQTGIEKSIGSWFGFKTPLPSVKKKFVKKILSKPLPAPDPSKKIIWLGRSAVLKGKIISAQGEGGNFEYELPFKIAHWLKKLLESSSIYKSLEGTSIKNAEISFPNTKGITFKHFICNEVWDDLFDCGLIII